MWQLRYRGIILVRPRAGQDRDTYMSQESTYSTEKYISVSGSRYHTLVGTTTIYSAFWALCCVVMEANGVGWRGGGGIG